MKNSHLSDDRLVEIGLAETRSADEQRHLGSCTACETRRGDVAHMLDEIAQAAVEDADAAFPAERLARQQVRILELLEHEGQPGRVLSFPAPSPERKVARSRPASRWVAAAAVAGLVVGLLAGRLGRDGLGTAATTEAARPAMSTTGVRAASVTLSDDEFLGQIERAADSRGGASLRALDDLTPRAWEVR